MIEVVGVGGSMKSQPYFAKLEKIIDAMGCSYTYTCWQRSNAPDFYSQESDKKKINLLYSRGVEGSRTIVLHYFVWMLLLFFYFLRQSKSRLFIVSRFDAAFPLYMVSLFFRVRYIYLDRDALYLSHKWSPLVARLLKFIEAKIGKGAVAHVIPGNSRNFTFSENVRIVENAPHSEFIVGARCSKFHSKIDPTTLSVYVNGWLVDTRGISMIVASARELLLRGANVRFLVAGVLGCDAAEKLVGLGNVEYFGVLENVDALGLYSRTDVVLSFYDPSIQINQRAEPNKWLDCAVQEVPFITNFGIVTASKWLEAGVAFSVNYGSGKELTDLLMSFSKDRAILQKARLGFTKMNIQPWDTAMSEVLKEAYEGLRNG